jgi:formyltetrahydrofolate deformylase
MSEKKLTATLLFSSPDRIGLVARISHFIFERGGNIQDLAEHVDPNEHQFFIRVVWDLQHFSIPPSELAEAFYPLAKEFNATWKISLSHKKPRLALFVSKYDHCLQEILWRHRLGEINAEIALIISNHPELDKLARHYEIPFHVFAVSQATRVQMERQELQLLVENKIDTIVLARYMQILSPEFVSNYPNQIINIHHSFLPAFVGGNPYRQAYQRGVKIIGATSHYVTADLDEGPIIEQDIIRISHQDTIKDLERKGRDLERLVLARALENHLAQRVLVHGRKTIVFA